MPDVSMAVMGTEKLIAQRSDMTIRSMMDVQIQQDMARQSLPSENFRVGELSSPEIIKPDELAIAEQDASKSIGELFQNDPESILNPSEQINQLNTINNKLEGEIHPITGVEFERDLVKLPEGDQHSGVFPKFEPKFEAQLSDDMLTQSDKTQFKECDAQLKDAFNASSDIRDQFTDLQKEQILNGDTPDGCTWHHNQQPGRMQLVDTRIHSSTAHTGGRSIWGGGSDMRGFY